MTRPTNEQCTWTRLPDLIDPYEVQPVQFQVGCNGLIARGAAAFYPDICPGCSKPVTTTESEIVDALVRRFG